MRAFSTAMRMDSSTALTAKLLANFYERREAPAEYRSGDDGAGGGSIALGIASGTAQANILPAAKPLVYN